MNHFVALPCGWWFNLEIHSMRIAFAASRNLSVDIIQWIHNNKIKFDVELVGGVHLNLKVGGMIK